MASSKRISLRESMQRVWERGGFTAESALRPITLPTTSGPLAPLPGLYLPKSTEDTRPTEPLPEEE